MFLSKIWMFAVAVGGAVAITFALVMPRPAERTAVIEERRKLVIGCGLVSIKLEDDALKRVQLTGLFAREPRIEGELAAASAEKTLDEPRMKKARAIGETVIKKEIEGRKPDLAILIDNKGRVVSRVFVEETEFGDVLAGRPLIDEALAGYLRDDLWFVGQALYFVSASPVIKDNVYVGAAVLGYKVTNEFSTVLVGNSLQVGLGFFRSDGQTIAMTDKMQVAIDAAAAQGVLEVLKSPDLHSDCGNDNNKLLELTSGGDRFSAIVARLPGEAGARGAYYSVFGPQPTAKGFGATLDDVKRSDLGFGSFPWFLVGGLFILVLGVGIALMLIESDRPLRKLASETVRLAKGEIERLAEDAHPGKFGSIARSVNIQIDKLNREAKSAKKDLDQLLGPAPEGSLGTIDLLATALPAARPGGPATAVAPPPSDFRFGDSGSGARPAAPPVPSARPGTPPPIRPAPPPMPMPMSLGAPPPLAMHTPPPQAVTPPPMLGADRAPLTLDDDILGGPAPASASSSSLNTGGGGVDPYFKSVYDQFIAMKKSCNEPTSGLTYEKFSEKLSKNRDDLRAKTGCREVRFTVYIKDGKAALKATPVKDE